MIVNAIIEPMSFFFTKFITNHVIFQTHTK